MINKPIMTFAGLAVAAVVAVAGVTKDQWMPQRAESAAAEAVTASAQTAGQQAAVVEKVPAQKVAAVATAVEQPIVVAQPAAVTPAAPSFDTVRVEKSGEALIAGRAQPGSEITVMLEGKAIGKTTANADGAFVLTPEAPLPAGSGALTIESKIGDQPAVQSEASVAVLVPAEEKKEILVAVVSAAEPTKILQKSEPAKDEVTAAVATEQSPVIKVAAATPPSLDAVDYDENGNIVFSGSGQANSTVRLYVDNTVAGDAKPGSDGHWSFAGISPIAAGKHTLRVDSIDSAGTVLSRVELPFFREEKSKVASATAGQTSEPVAATPVTAQSAAASAAVTPETTVSQPAATETKTAETVIAATETAVAETPPVETTTASEPPSATTTQRAVASAATTEAVKPKEGRIVIQPGNNLWRISRVIYGSGTKYTVIFEKNKDQIRNANLIFPGQVFMTPNVMPPEKIDPARRDSLKPEEGGGAG